jgi:hypothetical protein
VCVLEREQEQAALMRQMDQDDVSKAYMHVNTPESVQERRVCAVCASTMVKLHELETYSAHTWIIRDVHRLQATRTPDAYAACLVSILDRIQHSLDTDGVSVSFLCNVFLHIMDDTAVEPFNQLVHVLEALLDCVASALKHQHALLFDMDQAWHLSTQWTLTVSQPLVNILSQFLSRHHQRDIQDMLWDSLHVNMLDEDAPMTAEYFAQRDYLHLLTGLFYEKNNS